MTHTRPRRLFERHDRALTVLFADIEGHCRQQDKVTPGTAGSVLERSNADGVRFYAHQYYDGEKRKRTQYVAGPVGRLEADAAAEALRMRVEDTRGLVKSARLLIREGFAFVDTKTWATLATLHNHAIFQAGALLVGSHAWGVILNRMGVRATPFGTEDIDIVRPAPLAFEALPGKSLLEVLIESGVQFFPVPGLDRKAPPTSYKQRGRSRFPVDLLVPSKDETFPTVPVPELDAHARALPYLGYLVAESQWTAVLSRQGCCSVRVPIPERFAIHKLLMSRLRTGGSAKSDKDIHQAAVLCAALAESAPGAIADAAELLPERAHRHFRKALPILEPILRPQSTRAWEELTA